MVSVFFSRDDACTARLVVLSKNIMVFLPVEILDIAVDQDIAVQCSDVFE